LTSVDTTDGDAMTLVEMLRQENIALRKALWLKGQEIDELKDTLEDAREESAKNERLGKGMGEHIDRLERRTADLERRVAELCRWRVEAFQEVIAELEKEENEDFSARLRASRHHPKL